MRKGIKIRQRDITDCGAACLASVAAFYKLRLPVSRIRQYAGTDQRGTNLLGMIEAAEKLGFQARAGKATAASLFTIPVPAIAHINLANNVQHYVVVYKADRKYVRIMDPGSGDYSKRKLEDFLREWSGILLLLLPDTGFETSNGRITTLARFWNLAKPHHAAMIQALFGAVVYTILGLSSSVYLQKIIDFILVQQNFRLLNLLSASMIVLLGFQAFIGCFKSIFALRTGLSIDSTLVLGYYKHILQLPRSFFDTMRVGEIISRINDAVKIRSFINEVVLGIILNVLIIGFSFALMFLYYWKLAMIMMGIIPFYLLIFLIGNLVNKKWQRLLMEKSADLESQLVESITAAATVKQLGLEEHAVNRTESRFVGLLHAVYRAGRYGIYIGTASEFVTRLFTILLLWSGSYFVIDHELTPGELLSFYALISYFTGPAASLININKNIQDALIAASRLFEIIDLQTEQTQQHSLELTADIIGDIRFRDVSFRYGTRTMILEGLSFTIEKGKSTAIVGESGSGKSTIISLLQNMYPIQKGSIFIGDLNISQLSNRSLRHLIGVVPQNIDLFSGTITENIALGETNPDMKKILSLSLLLGLHDFIEKLPHAYSTMLSEQGINLSGGQRQRLAIARALYRSPEILLLDEATSCLDHASETKVQQALQWFRQQGKTIVMITHRLSTASRCDSILMIENGKITCSGRHDELIRENEQYASLWKNT